MGVVAPALSPQAVGQRVQPWRGFLLGYAQVPVEQMPKLVGQLAKVVRQSR
jgi:GntR family transcriptional regulator/MocR family aminotransferase